MKVPPDHCKGPQATSKGHAPLLIPVSTMGECKQANEFQSRHYGHTTIYYSWAESSRFAIQCCPTKHDSSYAWIHPSILPSIHVHLLAMLGSWITVSKFLILASLVMLLNQPWHFNHEFIPIMYTYLYESMQFSAISTCSSEYVTPRSCIHFTPQPTLTFWPWICVPLWIKNLCLRLDNLCVTAPLHLSVLNLWSIVIVSVGFEFCSTTQLTYTYPAQGSTR